jgi:hypothetical protein
MLMEFTGRHEHANLVRVILSETMTLLLVADCLINDDVRRFINFELSNQYMPFLRNCDGLNVSDKSFKVLKFDNNRITLEEEL